MKNPEQINLTEGSEESTMVNLKEFLEHKIVLTVDTKLGEKPFFSATIGQAFLIAKTYGKNVTCYNLSKSGWASSDER